jgi:hypothetical protein
MWVAACSLLPPAAVEAAPLIGGSFIAMNEFFRIAVSIHASRNSNAHGSRHWRRWR